MFLNKTKEGSPVSFGVAQIHPLTTVDIELMTVFVGVLPFRPIEPSEVEPSSGLLSGLPAFVGKGAVIAVGTGADVPRCHFYTLPFSSCLAILRRSR